MNQDIERILQAAGVRSIPIKYKDDPIAFMEAWLGLTDTDTSNNGNGNADLGDSILDTVEDYELNDAVYQCVIDWLIRVWKPETEATATTNLLLESNLAPDEITLDKVWDEVRAVRWIRHWMDLNLKKNVVSGTAASASTETKAETETEAETAADNGRENTSTDSNQKQQSRSCLSERLLQQGQHHGDSSIALLHALFYHIQYLPVLQSQIHRYSTVLQQQRTTTTTNTTTTATTTLIATPDLATIRIQHYQRAQHVGNLLFTEWEEHLVRLESIVGEFYLTGTVQQRVALRKLLGQTWSQFVRSQSGTSTGTGAAAAGGSAAGGGLRQENTRAACMKLTLNVLHRILLGVSSVVPLIIGQVPPAHHHLLFHQLLPLHRVEGMVLWRDQTAVLELYHEPLVQCIAVLLQKQPCWIPVVLEALLQKEIFPTTGNTPKQVLLLHEIDTYLGLLDKVVDWNEWVLSTSPSSSNTATSTPTTATATSTSSTAWIQSLLQVTSRCMASDHSRVSERALSLFQNAQFERIVQYKLEAALTVLLPALVRSEPSWNPTVRKMTHHVLTKLQGYDAQAFERVSNRVFCEGPNINMPVAAAPTMTTSSSVPNRLSDQVVPTPSSLSLKAGMGSWRPPTTSAARGRRSTPGSMPPPFARRRSAQPPVTVTGVAPWADNTSSQPPVTVTGVAPWANNASSALPAPSANGVVSSALLPPPLTVTGVAPWAMQTPPVVPTTHKRRAPEASLPPTTEADMDASGEINMSSKESSATGLERVLAYMKKIQPPEEEQGASSWSQAQMAETPTLLPRLKFHDLVFGHDLGAGAFGSVKYARLIDRTKTRSRWPEYAVKVVATEKIRELGYEASIQREIAVLRILAHPGIARLVSSFRFQEGAYLVLEYASGGDLHTLLRKHGSLDHDSTRFVMGEVVAALASVHDAGLVYADLKPENIVITEPGHVKLTDFGGCRPVTQEAKARIGSVAKHILKNLRDGGWKNQASKRAEEGDDPMDEDDVTEDEEDVRIEGTTAYLPPEVVMGSFPTTTADSWAFGCVLYQCLTGRPPLLEADEDSTRNRIVSFDMHESRNAVDRLFQDTHASAIRSDARDLIKSLLERDPSKRPGMHQIAQHDFFTKADVDVFNLHRQPAYPLDVGDVSPSPDAQWARRQFSSIWAPQPVAYNISLPDEDATFAYYEMSLSGPIPEGEEASGFFSTGASGHLPTKLGHISERAPLHVP